MGDGRWEMGDWRWEIRNMMKMHVINTVYHRWKKWCITREISFAVVLDIWSRVGYIYLMLP